MKKIKIAVLALFAFSVAIFAVFTVRDAVSKADAMPVIESSKDTISVSIDASEKELCAGLTATDKEDGDITDQIMVTNISNFISDNTCNISYAVFDSSEQLGTYTRKVTYTDYMSPRFSIDGALQVTMGGDAELLSKLHAEDVFDGDISNRILILSSTVNTAAAGVYDVTVQVSNSRGDVSELVLPVYVRDNSVRAPEIILKKSLVYLEKGAEFDAESYVDTAESDVNIGEIRVDSAVDMNQDGVYLVAYSAENAAGNIGNAYLTVVVGE